MTSVDNLCTWISVGNCVLAGLVLRAGEKGASMNLEAVQLYECSPVSERIFPGVAKLLDPTCHIFKSSYGWEPPNIYHTPRRARRRSAWESASQTKDDNGSPGCPITPRWEGARVDVQMGPKATQQCWPQRPLPCLLPQPDCPTALMPAGPCYSSCDTDPAGKVCLNCSWTVGAPRAPSLDSPVTYLVSLQGLLMLAQCYTSVAHSSLGETRFVSGQLKERAEGACNCDGHGDKPWVSSPYPSASLVLLLSWQRHIKA